MVCPRFLRQKTVNYKLKNLKRSMAREFSDKIVICGGEGVINALKLKFEIIYKNIFKMLLTKS